MSASTPESETGLSPVAPEIVELWSEGSIHNPPGGPRPSLEIYRPFPPARWREATVVIVPGGGFRLLSPFEKLLAEYFRSLGYTSVVINYRLLPHRYPAAFADVLRALRLVRHQGPAWGLPTRRIVLLGGSAGGYLAALATTNPALHVDPEDDLAAVSVRPDDLALLYPVISNIAAYRHPCLDAWFGQTAPDALRHAASPEEAVGRHCPRTILFHAADDTNAVPDNSIDFARACHAAGVPADLHVFARGGHGRSFAYDAVVSPCWRAILQAWLSDGLA